MKTKKILCLVLSICMGLTSLAMLAGAAKPAKAASPAADTLYSMEISPMGGTIYDYVTETISYSRKEETEYVNPNKLPAYIASGLSNACAITAGGAAIGHYDRLYENLIPNHTGITFLGKFHYGTQGDAVNAMHQELYTRMGATAGGTSVTGYKNGFNSYVANKGYTASLTSAYSNSAINKSQIMSALSSGKLLTVFMSGFSITDFSAIKNYSGYDEVTFCRLTGGHVVMCYGYYNVKYYNSADQMTREDCYLYVHAGYSGMGLAWVNIDKYITIDDAYITEIY